MISMQGVVLILIIVLIVFGPGKLPEVGRSIGRGLQEFRKAGSDLTLDKDKEQPQPPELDSKVIDATIVETKAPKQPVEN